MVCRILPVILLSVCIGATSSLYAQRVPVVYVAPGSEWKFHRGLTEASSPDTGAWRQKSFDDAAWLSGPAPFGFGSNDGPFGTDLSRLDPPMRGNYTTLFLRQTFEAVPENVVELHVNLDYDDGAVIWINGIEVLRQNVPGKPGDPLTHEDVASAAREGGTFQNFILVNPATFLENGTNIIAVQLFNRSISNADLRLDVELVDPFGPDTFPPQVKSLVPAPGSIVRRLSTVEVTFDEAVTGVDAADLRVAGNPATGVSGAAEGPYIFTFDTPEPGDIKFTWDTDHGIFDVADEPNAFGGGSWSLTLDPDAPPPSISINEFLAANRTGLVDSQGDESDWIEVTNGGTFPVNLAGWSLTDDAEDDGKWIFPNITLEPGAMLVVFASGKDLVVDDEIHTNFKLNSDGDYLGIYSSESPRELISEIAPVYPPQRGDISYGLGSDGKLGYFPEPTPGAPNDASTHFAGFAGDPILSVPHGLYTEAFDVRIASSTEGASIYYTLDGSEPAPDNGTLYQSPIAVAGTDRKAVVMLRAAAFKDGLLPSRTTTASYIFHQHVLRQPRDPDGYPTVWGFSSTRPADYQMDPRVIDDPGTAELARTGIVSIPTVSVVTDHENLWGRTGIYMNPSASGQAWERPCSAELIFSDGRRGFQADCGIRIQGGSSVNNWKAAKVSMRLLFKGDYGPTKLRHQVFPDTPVDRFDSIVLDAHLNLAYLHPDHGQRVRSQYTRDAYVSDLQNTMGGFAPHGYFVHLYLNGLYWGMYEMHERPDAAFAAEYFGGDKSEYTAMRHSSSTLLDGNLVVWTQMFSLLRSGIQDPQKYLELEEILNITDLADYMIANFYVGNDDWPHHNWYATHRRVPGGRFHFHSWDAEHVLKSVTINRLGENDAGTPGEVYTRLRASNEFKLLFADRVQKHFFNDGPIAVNTESPAWDPENPQNNHPAALYMERIAEIDSAIVLESARWGDNRRAQPYTRNNEWLAELNWLLTQYFPRRTGIVLQQFRSAGLYPRVDAPVFSQHGGEIEPGFTLTITPGDGGDDPIYFTIDGSDPREFGTNETGPSAQLYTGAIPLSGRVHVKARTLQGALWSALTEATFVVDSALRQLSVSEIMYNPAGGPELEFFELYNASSLPLDLGGLQFTNGIDLTFKPGTVIDAEGYLVLAANPEEFSQRYPGVTVGEIYGGNLDNAGEKVTLREPAGTTLFSVDYNDTSFWPLGADGFGYSLVPVDSAGDLDDPENWRTSATRGGSPGGPDPSRGGDTVVINEVLARASVPFEPAIELYNRGSRPVSVGGWYLSDSRGSEQALMKFRIPDTTVIAPGGFAVFYRQQFGAAFELSPTGGTVYLAAATGGGLNGYITAMEYGPSIPNVSQGRHATTVGVDVTALESPTFGAESPGNLQEFRQGTGAFNGAPGLGSVVVNEIMYHPVTGGVEFIELANVSDIPVSLFDAAMGRGWRLRGISDVDGIASFEFGAGISIPEQGLLVIVGSDPENFRIAHDVPAGVTVVGPFSGALDNAGERLRLMKPEAHPGGTTEPLYVTVDHVRYNDRRPWPLEADGLGPSLERVMSIEYGNEPLNWAASSFAGGTPGRHNSVSAPAGNAPPVASFVATPKAGLAPLQVALDASGSRDLDGQLESFEWDFGDGTVESGVQTNHNFARAGGYIVTLTVTDNAGAVARTQQLITAESSSDGFQIPGDCNQDGTVNLADGICVIAHLVLGARVTACDEAPGGGVTALIDNNGDGGVNLADAIYTLNYLFAGGPQPALGVDCAPIAGCPTVCAP